MMKLTLSPEAEEAVKRISPKVRAANRYSVKSVSALVSAIVVEFEPLVTPTTMAAKLVSRAGRRKALLATLSRVAQTADEKQLKRLENQLQRLQSVPDGSEAGPSTGPDSTSESVSQREKSL